MMSTLSLPFLVSYGGRRITGTVIPVDGGQHSWLKFQTKKDPIALELRPQCLSASMVGIFGISAGGFAARFRGTQSSGPEEVGA